MSTPFTASCRPAAPALSSVRRLVLLPVLLLALLPILQPRAAAQAEWEMRVCAAPNDYPTSARDIAGYDNRIAEILADELQATVSFVWTVFDADAVAVALAAGDCDLALGMADGAGDLTNTVPYYRTPFVFVYRADSPFEVRSLDDEVLGDLVVASYPNGLPWRALLNRGLGDNLTSPRPAAHPGGPDYAGPIVDAIVGGDIDVGILYGPEAAAEAAAAEVELAVVPVAPEIDPPLSQMFRIWTIAVRRGDEALRDRLNVALAARWEDIEAVFAEYGVPLQPLPQPRLPAETGPVRVGVVLPLASGRELVTDVVAAAARVGALLAEDLLLRGTDGPPPFEVLLASGPDADAAVRAAERLIVADGVVALIGGFGTGQAEVLARVAAERGVLFLDIGSTSETLRAACLPGSYHIEASAAMYIDALVGYQLAAGRRSWYVVHEDTAEGRIRAELTRAANEAAGGDPAAVETAAVAPGQFIYNDQIDRIAELGPDAVLLLLAPEDLELFLSQLGAIDGDVAIVPFPEPVTQTRAFFTRLRQVAPERVLEPRAALWEATLATGGAGDLNERFASRSGEPMDPAGWAAYAAVGILFDAVMSGADSPAGIAAHLDDPDTSFDLAKGVPLSFRSWDHQLRQPLYLVEIDPDAQWGMPVSSRLAIAALVGRVPTPFAEVPTVAQLDALGLGPERSTCGAAEGN